MPQLAAPTDPQAQVTLLKNTVRANKGHFTRLAKISNNLLKQILKDENPSDLLLSELKELRQKLSTKNDDVQSSYNELMTLDSANYDQYDANATTIDDDYMCHFNDINGAFTHVRDLRAAAAAAAKPTPTGGTPPAGGASPTTVRPRSVDALRPSALTSDHTPVEFRSWLAKFKAYHSASHFDICSISEQQAYLRACLSPDMETKMMSVIHRDTPVISINDADCLDTLEDEFNELYPLFARRMDFFRASASQGEKFSSFTSRLQQLGDEADLHSMGPDDIYVYRYLTACPDKKLREHLLRVPIPTKADFNREIKIYEYTLTANTAIHSTPNNSVEIVNKVSFKPHPNPNRQPIPDSLKGKCLACASKNHNAQDCQRKSGFVCDHCGRPGHTRPACFSRIRGEKPLEKINNSPPSSSVKQISSISQEEIIPDDTV